MGLRIESIITAVSSTIAAAALIGVAVMVIDLDTNVNVGQALQEQHLHAEESLHTMLADELLDHAERISDLEIRTTILETLRTQLGYIDNE